MSSGTLTYFPLRGKRAGCMVLDGVYIMVGFVVGGLDMSDVSSNVSLFVPFFVGLPALAMVSGLLCGRYLKSHSVAYSPPEWQFVVTELELDEMTSLEREHNATYFRLVARSGYADFFVPSVLVVGVATLPYYAADMFPALLVPPWQFLNSAAVGIIFLASLYASFKATSNAASQDFSPKLIREALWLAREQGKIRGVSKVTVLIDSARYGDLRAIRFPRVALRIEGLEHDALIQSWSTELRAVSKIQCSLIGSDGKPSAVWQWRAEDPHFVKKAQNAKDDYYVRFPVHSSESEVGVKDIRPLTENAIAIVCLGWLQTGGRSSSIDGLLSDLGVDGTKAQGGS